MIWIMQATGYHDMTIRFNDAAVCDKQGTPKLAIYAF